jgi:phosphoribosylamine--glycine ligase
MTILLLGSGGREDALAWRLAQSPSCASLIAAPGNPGIARWARCVALDPCDVAAVVALAQQESVGLVVVGPEAPLVAGVGDALRAAGIAVFGPNADAARLEGSKGFTKDLCAANGIPTAGYVRARTVAGALAALDRFSIQAGDGPMVIEEFMEGEEASLFALVDGDQAVAFASAQDHKRVGEGDIGPNTGGMGAYSPAPVLTAALEQRAMDEIVLPTARAMAAAGTPFSGVLFAGLMLTRNGPSLIEYNVRFGDPECEAIMPRVEGDFAALLYGVATASLASPTLSEETTMTVVVAAKGYPGTPVAGGAIQGIERAEECEGVTVFHAGTKLGETGLVASGGRVLAVTAIGRSLGEARERTYRAVNVIDFADGFHRRDIGWRELERAE